MTVRPRPLLVATFRACLNLTRPLTSWVYSSRSASLGLSFLTRVYKRAYSEAPLLGCSEIKRPA